MKRLILLLVVLVVATYFAVGRTWLSKWKYGTPNAPLGSLLIDKIGIVDASVKNGSVYTVTIYRDNAVWREIQATGGNARIDIPLSPAINADVLTAEPTNCEFKIALSE